jgi:hypothetical protein
LLHSPATNNKSLQEDFTKDPRRSEQPKSVKIGGLGTTGTDFIIFAEFQIPEYASAYKTPPADR